MPKARTSFTIEQNILDQAKVLSDSQFRSVSQTVEMLLADYIAQHPNATVLVLSHHTKPAPQPKPAPAQPANQPSN